ncbi:hypothetical protein BC937DRAFT_91708 [Endogone sp. FLAS-F59071]|nr:hypothetical protein BC937DRAFT_91708 [Endogone sp. FLAS-F59071]|eukprot:RUS16002.1 hypothetical protein BC937DRAFT_91708 [Endogone sp. FLAS-F59071]
MSQSIEVVNNCPTLDHRLLFVREGLYSDCFLHVLLRAENTTRYKSHRERTKSEPPTEDNYESNPNPNVVAKVSFMMQNPGPSSRGVVDSEYLIRPSGGGGSSDNKSH